MSFLKMFALACVITLPATASFAADVASLSDAQKKEVEAVVRELLTKKEPEIIVRAAQAVQDKMETEAAAKGQAAVSKNTDKLFNDPSAPIGGNPKGDVNVVEFFDYACGYCKMAQKNIEKLLDEDKNIRLIYKELPILGSRSQTIAKAALASVSQNKYEKFHQALMTSKGTLTESAVYEIAKETGLDVDKLKKDAESEKIASAIKSNIALAQEIGANGTPTFVIGDKVYGGAIPYEQLKEAVEQARKNKKK